MKSMQDVFRIFENDFFEAMRAGSFILNAMTTTFKMLNLTKPCLEAVADLGFSEPTPIQEQAIPSGLKTKTFWPLLKRAREKHLHICSLFLIRW